MVSLWLATVALASAAPISVEVGGAPIRFAFENFPRAASDEEVRAFVKKSAEPVAAYYGKFPVKKLLLEVVPDERNPKGLFGREFHAKRVVFYLGREAHPKENGILTHEMFHLGFPDLERKYAWLEEGLATYLAHLAMVRAGQTGEAEFWNDLKEGFEDSLPKEGDGGLGTARDYRRIYWGGALFWLEIDLEIRERSHGEKSLDTVTRAILAGGGTNAHRWALSRLRHAVDHYAGIKVFQKWYDFLGARPGRADLAALWEKLGLELRGGKLEVAKSSQLRAALLSNAATPLAKPATPQ